MSQIKRMMVELYAATTKRFNTALQTAVRNALIAILFMNCDLWQSKVSGEKFIGESATLRFEHLPMRVLHYYIVQLEF